MAKRTIHKRPLFGRKVVQPHNLRQTFMIFTEGQTEEGYFKKFKVRCKTVVGGNALNIVEEAVIQKNNVKKHVDHFWVVFDRDNTSKNEFTKAVELAKNQGLNVAYSCEAFEIWWLFHFMKITAPIQRRDYEKKLRKYLPDYSNRDKGRTQGERMWMLLDKIKHKGIENAKEAHLKYKQPEIAFDQSVTTAYELVEIIVSNSFR
jgi:hypothetical protein